jgi:general secretion pathway protein B
MSYILDALKRADAERGRGQVPGLNAQPLGASPEPSGPRHSRSTGPWLALVAVGVLAVAAAGFWFWRAPAPVAAPPAPVIAVAPPVPVTAPPCGQRAAGSGPRGLAGGAPRARAAARGCTAPNGLGGRAPAGGPHGLRHPPWRCLPRKRRPQPHRPRPPHPPRPRSRPPAAAPQARGAASKARGAASAAADALPVAPMLAEVPESARRGLPTLNVTGAVYSENPAQRLLLVNGLVLPQGATAAPEVVIEEIRARSATFNFRGTRFRVGF